MILSLICPRYIVQVSDRRLTYPSGKVATDEANKVVVIFPGLMMTYTGRSKIESKSSASWLAGRFRAHWDLRPSEKLQAIERDLTRAFESLDKTREDTRLAFVGVAWTQPNPVVRRFEPMIFLISNFSGPNGEQLLKAKNEFEPGKWMLRGRLYFLHRAGTDVEPKKWKAFDKKIRRLMQRKATAQLIRSHLMDFVVTASLDKTTIGDRVMYSMLENPETVTHANGQFLYRDLKQQAWIQYGPIVVSGSQSTENSKITHITPGDAS